MDLFIRTIGIARATAKIGLANLVYNIQRLLFLRPSKSNRTEPFDRSVHLHADANWCNKNDRWGHGNVL
jgi:hypothetical protein